MWPSLKQTELRRRLTELGWFCPRSDGAIGTFQLPRYPKDIRKKHVVYVAYIHELDGPGAGKLRRYRMFLVKKDEPMRAIAHLDSNGFSSYTATEIYSALMQNAAGGRALQGRDLSRPMPKPAAPKPKSAGVRPMSSRSFRRGMGIEGPVEGDKIVYSDDKGDITERRVKRVIRKWPDGKWEVEDTRGERLYIDWRENPHARENPGESPVEVFRRRWDRGRGSLTVFSHGTPGVPTLTDMEPLAKHLGATVNHVGMGVFIARRAGQEVFSFNAGSMMTREDGFSWDNMTVAEGSRKATLAWLRRKYPRLIAPVAPAMSSYWSQ